MARITFVYPDFESLGIEYLMSSCQQAGHEANYVYYQAEDVYLDRRKKSTDYEQIAGEINRTKPDVVGFSCVTDNLHHQLDCAQTLKAKYPGVFTIFGGIHPTAVPDKMLRYDCVDAVAIGEAEGSLVEFLNVFSQNGKHTAPDKEIPGIIYKNNGKIVGSYQEGDLLDLDKLPFPHKRSYYSVFNGNLSGYRIMTSRGCAYHCTFCFNPFMHRLRGRKIVRRRSVGNVIAELKQAKAEFSPKYILILDDSFGTDRRWLREFCDQYWKKISLPFACHFTPHYVDEEIAEILASANCVYVQIGVQSLSEKLCRDILERKSSNKYIIRAIKLLRQQKIMVQADHMLGIPGNTVENEINSLRFYNQHRPDMLSVVWLTYFPKIPIIKKAEAMGILNQKHIQNIEDGVGVHNTSYLVSGSMDDPAPYFSCSFLLNWLPLLPRWLVTLLINTRLYRLFRVRNYFITVALPRFIYAIFHKKDIRGRNHIHRFFNKTFGKKRRIT